jgi:hypothetical protein
MKSLPYPDLDLDTKLMTDTIRIIPDLQHWRMVCRKYPVPPFLGIKFSSQHSGGGFVNLKLFIGSFWKFAKCFTHFLVGGGAALTDSISSYCHTTHLNIAVWKRTLAFLIRRLFFLLLI